MKSLLKIFGVAFALLFQLTSCVNLDNDSKPIYYYYDEPVVVNQTGDNPMIRNESYLFYVPELKENTALKAGDLLWTSFTVELDDNPSISSSVFYYTARNFRYKTIDSVKVIIPADAEGFNNYLSDDYSTPIEFSALFKYAIDNLWFFGFKHRENSGQLNYTYELILNPEIENSSLNLPTLYIRAKLTGSSGANSQKAFTTEHGNIFAFDVKDFADYYKEKFPGNDKVYFNLKYKIDVDTSGKDVYKSFLSNPISWTFRTDKPE